MNKPVSEMNCTELDDMYEALELSRGMQEEVHLGDVVDLRLREVIETRGRIMRLQPEFYMAISQYSDLRRRADKMYRVLVDHRLPDYELLEKDIYEIIQERRKRIQDHYTD
jgi:hypothetical protein